MKTTEVELVEGWKIAGKPAHEMVRGLVFLREEASSWQN